ncbi:ATP-binding protein [Paenibacillus sp. 2TAB19]|uniref:ATP-binding protein n=1 Tax=Paenibacillus sp. 2TAB19 TaxID=3233003 RepID=UPI003F947992
MDVNEAYTKDDLSEETVNVNPDPRILVAITNNPMKPIDALCELIDNSIDSFIAAERDGRPIPNPVIQIQLPRNSEIRNNEGVLLVIDNGIGMSLPQLVKALKAGYTDKNPFDRLGLFGLGFNISTGKLGKRTVVTSARKEDSDSVEITIDLERMVNENTYDVPKRLKQKTHPHQNGTIIKIDRWWEEGTQNAGFIAKLSKLGIPQITSEIGRRYSTYIRHKNLKIFINDTECPAFEHCIWADHRVVKHNRWGMISAVYRFDKVLRIERRCTKCFKPVIEGAMCEKCGPNTESKTIEHRVYGWVGIQRFDDPNEYGVDLIRNGRVIRKSEKESFFTWTDNLGYSIKDYPIDSGGGYGRIVGEVHLNHVPTDFLKQDFQKTSSEWEEAIRFLRGNTSLQPEKAAESGEENRSPIFMLYQGYRRVRDFGTKDMYMGYWEPSAEKAKRIPREIEREYYQKFQEKVQGYYDDENWWKLVEDADKKPTDDTVECPDCGFQCVSTSEVCPECKGVLIGKACLNSQCGNLIPRSTTECSHCGTSQVPTPVEPWQCSFCARKNPPEATVCRNCHREQGEQNPFNKEHLLENSIKSDELSIQTFAINLPGSASMATTAVNVYTLKHGTGLEREGKTTPLIIHKTETLNIFIDTKHPIFTKYQVRAQDVIAVELAKWIQDQNSRHMSGDSMHLWSISSLYWEIIRAAHWGAGLAIDANETRNRIEAFFKRIKEELPYLLESESEDIQNNMLPEEKHELALTLVSNGFDPSQITKVIEEGKFLGYLSNRLIVKLIVQYAEKFFDGKFWTDSYLNIDLNVFAQSTVTEIRNHIKNKYRNFLEDILGYYENRNPDEGYTKRVNQTLELLSKKLI